MTHNTGTPPSELERLSADLASLPAEWITDAFSEALQRRAVGQSTRRQFDARLAQLVEVRAAAIASADLDAALDAAVDLLALDSLRPLLPTVVLDAEQARECLDRAARGLAVAVRSLPPLPVLDFDAEHERWREISTVASRSAAPLDPPVPTDLDRAAHDLRAAEQARIDAAHQSLRTWTASLVAHPDPVPMLLSARAYIESAMALGEGLQDVVAAVLAANAHRRESRLTWQPPAAWVA